MSDIGLILFAIAAVWFGSAWAFLRVGVDDGDVTGDVMDGALIFGPFCFAIVAYVYCRDVLRPWIKRAYRRAMKAGP